MNRFIPPKYCWSAFLLVCITILTTATLVLAQMNLTVNIPSATASPLPGELKYKVDLLVSVWGQDGSPVKNLKAADFSIQQDSLPVSLTSAEVVSDTPIKIALVLDNSLWVGSQIDQVRNAATNFASRLGSADQVAVYAFNSRADLISDFSSDQGSIRQAINSIPATQNSSCLFDALSMALEKLMGVEKGRRAVVVFTAGRDRLYDDLACSKITDPQVIEKATYPDRIPVYAIGAIKQIDISNRKFMDSISFLSGGYSIYPTDSDLTQALDADFARILDQVKYQYHLTYQTAATAGDHMVSVTTAIGSTSAQGNTACFFPEIPAVISFQSPINGDTFSGEIAVKVDLKGKIDAVKAVRLESDGAELDRSDQSPFDLSFDTSKLSEGPLNLTVVALDRDSKELSRATIKVTISVMAGTPTPSVKNTPGEKTTTAPTLSPSIINIGEFGIPLYAAIIAGGAVLLALLAFVVIRINRKNSKLLSTKDEGSPSGGFGGGESATMDGFILPSGDGLATLTVLFSDDPIRIGETIPMAHFPFSIGRGKDNDAVFEKDAPVSRLHACIEYNAGVFTLTEVETVSTSGMSKTPTYGTFINEIRVAGRSVPLASKAEIRLGNRLKLRFEVTKSDPSVSSISDEMTMDGIQVGDDTSEVN